MATELTKKQWIEILKDSDLTKETNIKIFQIYCELEKYKGSSKEVGQLLGYGQKSPQSPIHSIISHYAKRIANKHEIGFTQRANRKFKFWDLFFDGEEQGKKFIWILKQNIIEALTELNLNKSKDTFIFPEEISPKILLEGMKKTITINTYERNSSARKICIEFHGVKCKVCGFDFEKKYGELGKDYIHVHHKIPLSSIGEEYEIDPINDLVPLCPNCHAMIHRNKTMLTIQDLKNRIEKNSH